MARPKTIATPVKEAIVRAKETGQTDRAVANLFGISHQAVSKICRRYRSGIGLHRLPKSGRPRKTNERQERALIRVVRRDQNKTASDIVVEAKKALGLSISQRTAQRILRRAKLFARRPATKPLLKKCHRKARLAYALAHRHWSAADWYKVVWSDETRINMHNPDGGQWVRRPPGTRYQSKYVRPKEKYGAGCLMAWGEDGDTCRHLRTSLL